MKIANTLLHSIQGRTHLWGEHRLHFLHNPPNFLLHNPSPNHAIGAEHGPIFPPICHQLLLSQSTTFGTNTLIHGTSTVTYLTQVLCHTFSTPGQSKPHNTHFPLFVTNSFCHNPLNLGQILQFHWHPTLTQHMAHCV